MGLGASGGGTSTKHTTSEGCQWAVLVLVAASEEETRKKSEHTESVEANK